MGLYKRKSESRFSRVQQQVAEVTTIMKENVNKLFVRGDRLDELNERSENLRSAADEFHSASARSDESCFCYHDGVNY